MFDLFKSEWVRFRYWGLALFTVHLAVLGLMSRFVDLAQQPTMVYQVFGAVYFLIGSLLGLYQMGTYRRPNNWLNLLHRPVPSMHIAGGLASASTLILLAAATLPILILGFYQETFTPRVVDTRHFMLAVSAGLIALIGHACGTFAMTANRRYSFAIFVFPNLLMYAQATGVGMIGVELVMLVLIWLLIALVFKPDTATLPKPFVAVLALALPVQLAAYFLIWMLGFGYELGTTIAGTHPLNQPVAPKGGYIEANRVEKGNDMLLLGLQGSTQPDVALWREQAALSDIHTLEPMRQVSRRNELANLAPMEFDDETHRTRWVFSHDSMRFEGYGTQDNQPKGVLGVGDTGEAFPAPTRPANDTYLFNSRAVYQFDEASQHVYERMRLPEGELLITPPDMPVGNDLMIMSDKAVYVYSGRDMNTTVDLLKPMLRIPLPGKVGHLSRVDVMDLLDGYLVSVTNAWGVWSAESQHPWQEVLHVDANGHATVVARRNLRMDIAPSYANRVWWLSPVLRALSVGARDLFATRDAMRAYSDPMPRNSIILALICAVLSALGAVLVTAKQAHTPARRMAWVAVCAVIGLPALVALCLMFPMQRAWHVFRRARPAKA